MSGEAYADLLLSSSKTKQQSRGLQSNLSEYGDKPLI